MSNTTKRTVKGEAKVRNYLAFLADPSAAVNQTAVTKAYKRFEKETDPIAKLEAYDVWNAARTPDGSHLEADFTEVIFEWAQRKGISADSLIAQGVPRTVLRDAGFEDVRVGVYKDRVKGEAVRDWILNHEGTFTVTEAQKATHASNAGVRNVITAMVEANEVEAAGTQAHDGAGKPALCYQKV